MADTSIFPPTATTSASSSCKPLIMVEVVPLSFLPTDNKPKNDSNSPKSPCLSAPFVKLQLRQQSLRSLLGITETESTFSIQWESRIDDERQGGFRRGNIYTTVNKDASKIQWAFVSRARSLVPLLFIESDDPTQAVEIPCWAVGFSRSKSTGNPVVSEETLVRVLPIETAISVEDPTGIPTNALNNSRIHARSITDVLSGEVNVAHDFDMEMDEEVLRNHDTETVESLKLRMGLLLSQPVTIGTTAGAFTRHKQKTQHSLQMQHFLQTYSERRKEKQLMSVSTHSPACTIPSLLWEGSLTVHSPFHGSGKTLLVKAIARRYLKCTAVHIVQPGPLLAKYGIHADAGLESMLHGITASAAVHDRKDASICVVLDNLDCFCPPTLSGSRGAGDGAVPVLNAIASYLKSLSLSLKHKKEFPFPTKNPAYNLGSVHGETMAIRVCIVGVVTCPDGGGLSMQRDLNGISRSNATVVDALGGGQFRLPNPSAKARLMAFRYAFEQEQLNLSDEAKKVLPVIAASAVSARGIAFHNVAVRLRQMQEEKKSFNKAPHDLVVSSHDLEEAIAITQKRRTFPLVSFLTAPSDVATHGNEACNDISDEPNLFASVGGNTEAKRALEDALALDPERRRQMSILGFSAPIGVLLYGPPGTGKTILAKAVAELLRSQGSSALGVGGAFISLRASDIVRSEVGNSEKMVVTAFETARTNAPAVVFIDEFQALFTERSFSGSGRLTSTLLQCMDDVTQWRDVDLDAGANGSDSVTLGNANARVVVLAATNTPWLVDKAFLRPGRFDQVVHVGLPNLSERTSILRVHMRKMRLRDYGKSSCIESLCKNLAGKCDGFSGADLVALCRAAAIRCLAEQGDGGSVELKHFVAALEHDVKCSSSIELVQRLSRWHP